MNHLESENQAFSENQVLNYYFNKLDNSLRGAPYNHVQRARVIGFAG